MGVNPSMNEIEMLVSSLEKTLTRLYGEKRSRIIFDRLRKELIEYNSFFKKYFSSKIEDTLNNFFEMKGIPKNSEILEIAGYLISDGYEETEEMLIEKLKQLTRERIMKDLREILLNYEIKSFFDNNSSYSEMDIEVFKNELKNRKFEINEIDLKDNFEKERLFRKFNYMERKENEEIIVDRYLKLFDSHSKKEYEYIISNNK